MAWSTRSISTSGTGRNFGTLEVCHWLGLERLLALDKRWLAIVNHQKIAF